MGKLKRQRRKRNLRKSTQKDISGNIITQIVGTQQNKESKRLFLRGYEEMMKRLSPEWVIFYGKVPEECDWNVIRVKPHYDEIVKRRKANEISVSAGSS